MPQTSPKVVAAALALLCGALGQSVGPTAQTLQTAAADSAFQWDVLRGGFKQVFDLSVDAEGRVWGAGMGGIFRQDRGAWRVVAATGSIVKAIDVTGPGDGWALVGGQLWRYDGPAWTPVNTPDGYILDVALAPEGGAWALAAGDGAAMLWRYDEAQGWRDTGIRTTPMYNNLDAVDDVVWLAGPPGIARCDSSQCVEFPLQGIKDIDMVDPNHGWAVGGDCGPGGARRRVVLQYDSGEWRTVVDSNDVGLNTVAAADRTTAVAAGYHSVVLRITADGTQVLTREPGTAARCVEGLGASARDPGTGTVFVGGSNYLSAAIMTVEEDDDEAAFVHGYDTSRLAFRSPSEGWVVEDGKILSYRSGTWSVSLAGDPPWNDVSVAPDGLVWASGDSGRLALNSAGRWEPVALSINDDLLRVVSSPGRTALLLGRGVTEQQSQTSVYRTDTRAAELLYQGPPHLPRDITVAPDGTIWIVGRGTTVHGKGSDWHSHEMRRELFSVTAADDAVWAVTDGAVFNWIDDAWEPESRVSDELAEELPHLSIRSIHAHSARDVWAGGQDGTVFHFDGAMWRYATPGMSRPGGWFSYNEWVLRDMVTIQDSLDRVLLVAGDSATVMRHRYVPDATPTPPPSPTPDKPYRIYLPSLDVSGEHS